MLIPTVSESWTTTPDGDPRGYIKATSLSEVWFHTGTKCNLSCDFCLEGSSPGDKRLDTPSFEEVKPFIDEAVEMGVAQFSFTGGEPFLARDLIAILDYASQFGSCLVLTNGTKPLLKRIQKLAPLLQAKFPVSFRVSLDSPYAVTHNAGRGEGQFEEALVGMKNLKEMGFSVSVARHIQPYENTKAVNQAFSQLFTDNGLPKDTNIVAFPDFLPPGSLPEVPHISEHCMTTYQTEAQRQAYMCANSRMVVKKDNQLGVYACTLVDDDEEYNLGESLRASLEPRVSMRHHRCYSCFAMGASCSEL